MEQTLTLGANPVPRILSFLAGMGMVILPPGQTSSAHSHQAEQEVWYVISGQGSVRIGADQVAIRPDTVVVAPPGVSHQLVNDGDEDLKAIWIFTPAGPEADYLPPEEGEEKSV